MKKYVLTSIMGVLFCIGLTSMVNLSRPVEHEPINCKAICSEEGDEFVDLFSSKGKCISTCKVCTNPSQSVGNTAVCICKLIDAGAIGGEDGEGPETPEFDNFGQCVNFVKDAIKDGREGPTRR